MNFLLDILFPKHCLGCNKEGLYICKKCELFMNEVNNIGNLAFFWEYNGIVKMAIHQAKYGSSYDILKELVSKKDFEIDKNAVITYVPMHIKKKKQRGFNQAEIIAKEIGKKTGVPVAKMLEKVKETPEQAKLDKPARIKNLKNSFKLCGRLSLSQESVLLVDDVFTTGATMEECGKVLLKAGFKNISYFALAKTV